MYLLNPRLPPVVTRVRRSFVMYTLSVLYILIRVMFLSDDVRIETCKPYTSMRLVKMIHVGHITSHYMSAVGELSGGVHWGHCP